MLCFKRFPLVLCYSFVFALVSSFFFLPGPVSATSVSSYTLTFDANSDLTNDVLLYQDVNATMSGTPVLNFIPVYVEIIQSGYSSYYRYCGSNGLGILTTAQVSGYNASAVACMDVLINSTYDLSRVWDYSTHNYILLIKPSQFSSAMSWMPDYTITYTFYDSLPSSDCPDCPPVPENPYDDKLDKIYHAIILVPAMAFVLYLFFILYSWYVGGRK